MADQKMLTMDELKTLITDTVEKSVRDLGIDKVDAKHGIFPSAGDPNGDDLQNLTKEQKVNKFLKAVFMGEGTTAKALSEGTAADGGYLVPTEFRAEVITKLKKTAVIRPRATVIPMGSDSMDIPVEANGVTLTWTAENTDATESNPTFGNVSLAVNTLNGLSKTSRQLLSDSKIDLMDFVSTLYAQAFAAEEDEVFMAGDGTGKPKGIRTYALGSNAQAGANLVGDDIVKLFYKLASQYRQGAVWLMPNSIVLLARLLKDDQGRYLWTDGFNDAPPTLMGKPVLEQNDIPTNLGAGTNESEIFFGDLSRYIIGDREQMGIETTTVGAGTFEKHQAAIKCWERIDGKLGLTEAVVKMTAVK